jgi:hypothetical protein
MIVEKKAGALEVKKVQNTIDDIDAKCNETVKEVDLFK